MKLIAPVIIVLATLTIPNTARGFQFSFTQPIPRQGQVEHSIRYQINRQVARHWHITPVSFVPSGGIPIHIESSTQLHIDCQSTEASGCHSSSGIYIDNPHGTVAIDHEIIETEVDPHPYTSFMPTPEGKLIPEPCDVVEGVSYMVKRVWLSDFIYPRWYWIGSKGPWDWEQATNGPLKEVGSDLAITISGSTLDSH